MSWYMRVHATLTALTAPWLRATEATSLALLVRAILAPRPLPPPVDQPQGQPSR